MNSNPAEYHRNSKQWHELLGKTGTVILATQTEIASEALESFLPYCFLILELDDAPQKRIEVMGEAQVAFKPGDRVSLQLRRVAEPNATGILPYGLKACKQFA